MKFQSAHDNTFKWMISLKPNLGLKKSKSRTRCTDFFGSESKKVPRDETSLKQFNVPATVASSGKFFVPVHDAGKLLLRGNANETCHHPCAAAGHRVPWSVLMIHGIQLFQWGWCPSPILSWVPVCIIYKWGFPKKVGFPNNHGFSY